MFWFDGPVSEGRFSAEEIAEAYAAVHTRVQGYVDAGDWSGFADNFTEDAVYVEHAFGTFRGRDEIRAWSVPTMTTFPGRHHDRLPAGLAGRRRPDLAADLRGAQPDAGPRRRHPSSRSPTSRS